MVMELEEANIKLDNKPETIVFVLVLNTINQVPTSLEPTRSMV